MRHGNGHGAFKSLSRDRELAVRMCRALSLYVQRFPDEGADGTASAFLAITVSDELRRCGGPGAHDPDLLALSYSDWLNLERRGGTCGHSLSPAVERDCFDLADALVRRELAATEVADFKRFHAQDGEEFSEVVAGAFQAGNEAAWGQLEQAVHTIIAKL